MQKKSKATLIKELREILHPSRFTGMSGKMAAILGYILGVKWTEPEITELSITSDGFLVTTSHFLGTASDLETNIRNLFEVVDLSPEHREVFNELFRDKVSDFRANHLRPVF